MTNSLISVLTIGILELWCMIETAKGVQNVDLIASLKSVQTLVFGSNDLTKDLKARHTPTRYNRLDMR